MGKRIRTIIKSVFMDAQNKGSTIMMLQMGLVKWYNQAKGYGFICPMDGSSEIYVQRASIANTGNKSLNAGQRVEFTTYRSVAHGPAAADVIAF